MAFSMQALDCDSAVGQICAMCIGVQWLWNVLVFNYMFMEELSSIEKAGISGYKYSKPSWSAQEREVSSPAGGLLPLSLPCGRELLNTSCASQTGYWAQAADEEKRQIAGENVKVCSSISSHA